MNLTNWWKRAAVGGVATLTLAAGLLVAAAPAFAQSDHGTSTAPPSGFMQRGHMGRHGGFGGFDGFRGEDRNAALAEQLGITVEELEAAQEALRAEAVATAVAEGRITQEEADLMEAGRALHESIDRAQIMADVLGVTVEELEAAREAGTLRDLMAEVDHATLHEKLQAAMDSAVAQAVADGVITQEQADQLRGSGKGFSPRGMGGRHPGGRGFDGPGGRFGTPDAPPQGEGL